MVLVENVLFTATELLACVALADTSRPVAFSRRAAPAVPLLVVTAIVRPVLEDSVIAPVTLLVEAVMLVAAVRALIAVARAVPCVDTLCEPVTAPMLTPLITRSPACRSMRPLGALVASMDDTAEAVTPVWPV